MRPHRTLRAHTVHGCLLQPLPPRVQPDSRHVGAMIGWVPCLFGRRHKLLPQTNMSYCSVVGIQGRGQICQGTISTGVISEEDNFATTKNPEACCYFLVGSGWFLIFPGGLCVVSVTCWWALDGCFSSWWAPDPPASEFTVKLLVTRCETFAGADFLACGILPSPKSPPPVCLKVWTRLQEGCTINICLHTTTLPAPATQVSQKVIAAHTSIPELRAQGTQLARVSQGNLTSTTQWHTHPTTPMAGEGNGSQYVTHVATGQQVSQCHKTVSHGIAHLTIVC